MKPDPIRIAIYGPAKTGTSALYYKIRDAFAPAVDGYFEPGWKAVRMAQVRQALTVARLRRPHALVAKFLPFASGDWHVVDRLGPFDREILLVRDPRDRLVSAVLYSVYHARLVRDDTAAHALLDMIRAKEVEPDSVTLLDIVTLLVAGTGIDLAGWIASYAAHSIETPMAFDAAHRGLHAMRYENLVDHRYDDLGAYLGVVLAGPAEVEAQTQRVVRTKAYGDWANWFTRSDIARLAPVLDPYLRHYYPDATWDRPVITTLPAATGSGYVARLIDEARHGLGLGPLGPAGAIAA